MSKNYIYNNVAGPDACYAVIDGVRFQIVQYAASWAVNEIPTAACMLAIGREARTGTKAAVHTNSNKKQMVPAQVWFTPTGEYSLSQKWPSGSQKIFDGFFAGFSYRKINGKVHAIARLLHWTAALTFSSCLTKSAHVANPTQLNAAAVLQTLGGSGASQGNNISCLVPAQLSGPIVQTDLWSAIKSIFCALAARQTLPVTLGGECGGGGQLSANTGALQALAKIEGPAASCPLGYTYGKPLKLDVPGGSLLPDAISLDIGTTTIESYSTQTFWDKLVGQFCPDYGMAVVPMVNSALVIADTPAFNGGVWKTISPDEYDDFNMDGDLHHPLQAIVVIAAWVSQTQNMQNQPAGDGAIIGGCFVAPPTSGVPADGIRMYISPSPWLAKISSTFGYVIATSGLGPSVPIPTSTTPVQAPAQPRPTPGATGNATTQCYERYAQAYYVNQILRGRNGSISGKLRFDIAPGSIIQIQASQEKFIGAEDDLAFSLVGCVTRVTQAINCESGMAGTTLMFDHNRTAAENAPSETRTSVAQHPLFSLDSIHGSGKHGAPLLPIYDIPS